MLFYLKFIFILSYLCTKCFCVEEFLGNQVITTKMFMFWPNATVPFFINPDHFDHEQSMAIMTALSLFAFKTCLKFAPVMAAPTDNQHVLVFVNPGGIRRCKMDTLGHSIFTPHILHMGYDCLQSPQIDMYIMKALGFPFEHNRMSRDVYIDVMIENIQPSAIGLFTKESVLPPALRALPYDVNSVMHFGEREYSKNGHRTIIIKSPNVRQNRIGLSANDVRKIEMVYGAECRARDRQEKIELCQSYPGVARRKRELDPSEWKSLRVNPDITPPTSPRPTTKLEEEKEDTQYITDNLKALGIEKESQAIIEEVYKVSALALQHAREKFCNISSNSTTVFDLKLEMPEKKRNNSSDLLGILEIIADYAKSMIDDAVSNIVVFCKNSDSIAKYQRQKIWCGGSDKRQCTKHYKPTKSGFVRQSTQHRPVYKQSTKHDGAIKQYSYDNSWRSGNATEISNSPTTSLSIPARRKREATETTTAKEKKVKEKKILKEKVKGQKEKEKEVKKDDAVAKTVKSANVTIKPVLNVTRRFFQEKRYKSWLL